MEQERVPLDPQTQGTQARGTALLISMAQMGLGRAELGTPHDFLQRCWEVASKAFCHGPVGPSRAGRGLVQHHPKGQASRGPGTAWHWVQPCLWSFIPWGQPGAGGTVRKGHPWVYRAMLHRCSWCGQ